MFTKIYVASTKAAHGLNSLYFYYHMYFSLVTKSVFLVAAAV